MLEHYHTVHLSRLQPSSLPELAALLAVVDELPLLAEGLVGVELVLDLLQLLGLDGVKTELL